jgi:hypothetical protein
VNLPPLPRPTYANVVATICLLLLVGGGVAAAATRLAPGSVGRPQIKRGAVSLGKLSRKARQRLQGQVGPAGATGATGPAGLNGTAGPSGEVGPMGPRGAEGPQGDQGPKGEEGSRGPEGPKGDEGPKGAEGPKGGEGAKGPEGPPGPVAAYAAQENSALTFPTATSTPLEELAFPAGSYVITATQSVTATKALPGRLECEIVVDGVDAADFVIDLAPERAGTMTGVAVAPAGSESAQVTCEASTSGGEMFLLPDTARLVAVRVDSIE